jgi:mannose-1-phosphate guanylyltransferase
MAEPTLARQHPIIDRLWGIVTASTRARPPLRFLFSRRHALGRTPLSSVLERASGLITANRLVAVLARGHERDADAPAGVRRVVQPAYRGSASEVFLPLLAIVHQDPRAIVVVLPPDAAGQDEPKFLTTVEAAAEAVALRPDLPIVVGLAPPCARPPGWLLTGELVAGLEHLGVREVRRFVRRPSFAEAGTLGANVGLVSTGVIVAQADTVLDLGRRHLPDVLETLEPLESALGGPEERLLCEAVYEAMPYADFSHALFAAGAPIGVVVIPRTQTRVRPVASA